MQTPEPASRTSFLNVNAGARPAEKAKTEKYRALSMHSARTDLCSGYLHHQWGHRGAVPTTARVEEEDLELGIGPWPSRRRKQTWLARFDVEIAKCNTRMVSRSQHISLVD